MIGDWRLELGFSVETPFSSLSSLVLLSLPLVVLGILTNDPDDTFAANNLALFTALFDGWLNFHDISS